MFEFEADVCRVQNSNFVGGTVRYEMLFPFSGNMYMIAYFSVKSSSFMKIIECYLNDREVINHSNVNKPSHNLRVEDLGYWKTYDTNASLLITTKAKKWGRWCFNIDPICVTYGIVDKIKYIYSIILALDNILKLPEVILKEIFKLLITE